MNIEHYISGLGCCGELLGISDAKLNPGITLDTLSKNMIHTIKNIANTNKKTKLFVDSGAFAEIKVIDETIQVVKPITHKRWTQILDTYQILAETTQLPLLVAPDAIGNQDKTIQRLKTYKNILQQLAKHAKIIVPLQKGKYNTTDFQNICLDLLDFPLTSGIPFKKQALSINDYIHILKHTEQRNIHILGLSKAAKTWPQIKSIHSQIPHNLSLDSARLRALVGRKPQPKPYTHAQDIIRKQQHTKDSKELKRKAISLITHFIDKEYSPPESINLFPY